MLAATERAVKGPLFGCRMCGNCLLQETAFICPMECPKGLRNGPCGGSVPGICYVDNSRPCIWHEIFERSEKMNRTGKLLEVLPPLDWNKSGTETWGEVMRTASESGTAKFLGGLLNRNGKNRYVTDEVFRKIRQPEWWNGDSIYHPPQNGEPVSVLEKELRAGKFVFTTEVLPPLHSGTEKLRKNIEAVKPYVSAVNFTDNSSSVPRMSGLSCCREAAMLGLDPVLQLTARDNNRYALQSKALGANSEGVRNILCITGDFPTTGPSPAGSMQIYDLDSVQMLWILRRMRDEGKYLDGRDIKTKPNYFLGAAASPFASKPAYIALREEKKINAGAQFLQTNLAFDTSRLEDWLGELDKRNLLDKAFILVGVAPLRSVKMAYHLRYEVPGVTVPDELVRIIETAGNGAPEAGIEYSIKFIERIRNLKGVSGIHLMTMGCEETVGRITGHFRNLNIQ
jgi:methylenetetrahydrofolate reductase (NADPH)